MTQASIKYGGASNAHSTSAESSLTGRQSSGAEDPSPRAPAAWAAQAALALC